MKTYATKQRELHRTDMPTHRMTYLDNLRVFLTVLVIFHHSAITYGAKGGWYWYDLSDQAGSATASAIFTPFCAINQAYFMGFFFLIAGHFLPTSLERKGVIRFLIDRCIRLGIPTLVFGFLLGPITIALARTEQNHPFGDSLVQLLQRGYYSPGPLWFTTTLLIFTLIATLTHRMWSKIDTPEYFPNNGILFISAVSVSISAFFIRLLYPIGSEVFHLQLGFFASYIVLFIAGLLSSQTNWMTNIPVTTVRVWFIIAVITLPILPITLGVLGGMDGLMGGWNIKALVYAFWEPFLAWGIILTMLRFFQDRMSYHTPISQWFVKHTYAVFILHTPVLVGTSLLLRSVSIAPLLKFLIAGSVTVVICFLVSSILLLIPALRRIL